MQGVPAPAKVEDGSMLRLDRGMRMMLSEKHCEQVNGVSAKIRLNDQRQSWSFGLYFDVTDKDAQQKWIAITSNGKLEYLTIENRRSKLVDSKDLPVEIKVGKWVELAYVADSNAGEVVFYIEKTPVFAVKAVLDAKSVLGLQAEGDVSFKEIRVRRGK